MNIVELKRASSELFQEMEAIASSKDIVNQKRLELLTIKRNEIWRTLRDRVREKHNDAEVPERRISETVTFPVMSVPDHVLVETASTPHRYENESYTTPSSAGKTRTMTLDLARRRMSSLSPGDAVVHTVSSAASRSRFDTYVEPDTKRVVPPSIPVEPRQHRLSSIAFPTTPLTPTVPSLTQDLTERSERLEAETSFNHPVHTSLASLLRALYRKVEPSKLENKSFLNQVLEKYNGYEDLLASRLSAKYSDRAPREIAALRRWIHKSQHSGNLNRRESVKPFVDARADAWVRANLSSGKQPVHHRKGGLQDLDASSLSRTPDIYSST